MVVLEVYGMPYREPTVTDEEGNPLYTPGLEYMQEDTSLAPYQNPENVFIKHLTEIQFPEHIEEEFRQRWSHRLMFSGKEKSTSFIENPRT